MSQLVGSIAVRGIALREWPAPAPHSLGWRSPCVLCALRFDAEECKQSSVVTAHQFGRGQNCVTRHVIYLQPGAILAMDFTIIERGRVVDAFNRALQLDPCRESAASAVASALCLSAEAVLEAVTEPEEASSTC